MWKRICLFLAFAVSLFGQTVTTQVTLTWTYNFGSEVACSSTVLTLCDDSWEYGTVSGGVFTPIANVGLPTALFPSYTVLSIPAPGTLSTLLSLTPTSPVIYGSVLGGLAPDVIISGATGTGCSGLNGTFAMAGVSNTPSNLIAIAYNSSGCTYTASSATAIVQYQVTFQTSLSGSTVFAIVMAGRDGAGMPAVGSFTSSEVTVTLPTPPTPSSFSSGNASSVGAIHVP
jgi:hypothetical protein